MVLLALAFQTKISFFVIAGVLFAVALAFAVRAEKRLAARCPKLLDLRNRINGVTRRFYSARHIVSRGANDKHYRQANDLQYRATDLYNEGKYTEASEVAALGLAEMQAFYDALPNK